MFLKKFIKILSIKRLSLLILFIIFSLYLIGCTPSYKESNSRAEYISTALNQHINNTYLPLLEKLRLEKGITTIYFKSISRALLPTQIEIKQCWVTSNATTRPLPAFSPISDNSFYSLTGVANTPCYLKMIIDYSEKTRHWDIHVYNFNAEQLPVDWVYRQILRNIEVGLYNLTL